MKHIQWWVCIAAFAAEVLADSVIDAVTMVILGQGTLSPDLDSETLRTATQAIVDSSQFLAAKVILGTATTVGGGYLAARLAKTYPYYNGLGIGIIGLVFSILMWGDPLWLNVFAVLTTIPASIYGAHLAKGHIPPQPPQ
jgi:hypothetical protein